MQLKQIKRAIVKHPKIDDNYGAVRLGEARGRKCVLAVGRVTGQNIAIFPCGFSGLYYMAIKDKYREIDSLKAYKNLNAILYELANSF